MEYFMGIRGKDFVMLCTDTSAVQQIITIKHDEAKLLQVNDSTVLALSGEPGDRVQFSEFIKANIKLYELRNGRKLRTSAIANYIRSELANALRQRPYSTNLLIAGHDEGRGPSLYWCDYLATMHRMNIAGTGYGSYFVLSMLDRLWHPDLTEADALQLHEKGIAEVKKRLVVAPSSFSIQIVDANGVRTVKTIRGDLPGASA